MKSTSNLIEIELEVRDVYEAIAHYIIAKNASLNLKEAELISTVFHKPSLELFESVLSDALKSSEITCTYGTSKFVTIKFQKKESSKLSDKVTTAVGERIIDLEEQKSDNSK